MKGQLEQILNALAALQNPSATTTPPSNAANPTPPTTNPNSSPITNNQPPITFPQQPSPPTFPAAPTGNSSTTDHKARFMEIYKRNPYEAAEYLQKHPSEMAEAAKDLLVG